MLQHLETSFASGLVALACLGAVSTGCAQAQAPSDAWVIGTSVLAVPANLRDAAEVRRRGADGSLETVRTGTNEIICLSDVPGDESFAVTCYHTSLEPFMARGRELRAEGVEGMEYQETRWAEARAGSLQMPEGPAMVYNLRYDSEEIDPATFDPTSVGRLHAVYIPNATPESTGLPTSGEFGGPWLMWPGEPSSHIMIQIPPSGGS